MTDILKVQILGTEEILEIPDVTPMPSAEQFKALSDAVWGLKPPNLRMSSFVVVSAVEKMEVRDTLNGILGDIDEAFVISGIGKALNLGQPHGQGDPVILGADTMDNPVSASVETYNWDARNNARFMEIDGEEKAVTFADGHVDYYRELGIRLGLRDFAVATYSMQRMQASQDGTTSLHLSVWHRDFAEMGYEGHQLAHADISEQQEMSLLGLMQRMVGDAGPTES